MAKQIRHILVAIGNLQHVPKNVLRKAAALARASGASASCVMPSMSPIRTAAIRKRRPSRQWTSAGLQSSRNAKGAWSDSLATSHCAGRITPGYLNRALRHLECRRADGI
jgi:hypothetical protein